MKAPAMNRDRRDGNNTFGKEYCLGTGRDNIMTRLALPMKERNFKDPLDSEVAQRLSTFYL